MAIYTFDFSEDENWTFSDANISDGTLNITDAGGYGQRIPDANWLSGANDDFEIEFDFKFDGDWSYVNDLVIKLEGDDWSIHCRLRASVYDLMQIYYKGAQRVYQSFVATVDTWYIAKIRRVGTTFYFSINGGDEISWDYGTARAIEYIRLGVANITGKFDNFIYRWIEEEEIVKIFEDTFTGTDSLLTDKNLIFLDTMLGTDKWILPNITYKTFSDVLACSDNFLKDMTALFEDTFSGVDVIKVNKTITFFDTFSGVDVFLLDKEVVFKDVFSAIEKFYASYPYPKGLKRKIIIIRDIK